MTGIFLRKEIRTYTQERLWGTQEVMAVYKPDGSFRMKPTLLTFWSWITYYPPNWKEISLYCLSHPSLWYLVIAAAAKSLQSYPTVWPHRRQPTRLPRPWDSPGKNTGMGCHFLLQPMKVKSESEVIQSCPTLSNPMDCSLPGSSVYGIFQAKVLEWGAIAFSVSYSSPCKLICSAFSRQRDCFHIQRKFCFFEE